MRLICRGGAAILLGAALLVAGCNGDAGETSSAEPQAADAQRAESAEPAGMPQGPEALRGMPPMHPMTSRDAATGPSEPIAPPPGGLSIADVWAKAPSLAGKRVTVRGKVVKFLGGIMERNWIHLQDGSGSAADGTHDLTVTTDEEVSVGDIVTATGVLAADKDFTAGYVYKAILEQASIE